MLKKFVATIVKFSHTKRSPKNKIVMMLFGAINLLVVIPFVFFQVGGIFEKYILVNWLRPLEIVTAILSVVWGLFS